MSIVDDFQINGLLLERVYEAILELRDALGGMPQPQVHVEPVDLGEIVSAVNGLRPSVSADEIGVAVARALQPGTQSDVVPVLAQITDQLSKIEWASRAPNAVIGGGVLNLPERLMDGNSMRVSDPDVRRGITDFESRLDYDVRSDTQPVYVGRAAEGTATSAGTWVIEKLTYDVTDRPTRKQVLIGAWDNRASLSW